MCPGHTCRSLCGYFCSLWAHSYLSWVCLGWALEISLHPFPLGHPLLLMPNFLPYTGFPSFTSCSVECISTEPLWYRSRTKPKTQLALGPENIHLLSQKCLYSISGSQMSTFCLAVLLQGFAFLEQSIHLQQVWNKSFQGCRSCGIIPVDPNTSDKQQRKKGLFPHEFLVCPWILGRILFLTPKSYHLVLQRPNKYN